jgi:hypothetical protein
MPEPERELVRRGMPLALPALSLAVIVAGAIGGWHAAWSAAIGVAIVFVNFAAHGLSLARAARASLQALAVVAVVGFAVRLAAIVALLFGLDRLAWFSPLAFGLAVIPCTLMLLGYEAKLLGRGVASELVIPPAAMPETSGRRSS